MKSVDDGVAIYVVVVCLAIGGQGMCKHAGSAQRAMMNPGDEPLTRAHLLASLTSAKVVHMF